MISIVRLRLFEWITSLVILALGMIMWLSPESFYRTPSLQPFASHAIEWTIACLSIGLARLLALYVNGHWVGGTPLLRLIGSIAGATVFGAFVGNFMSSSTLGSIAWPIATYTGLMVGELISSFFSASDVYNAKRR